MPGMTQKPSDAQAHVGSPQHSLSYQAMASCQYHQTRELGHGPWRVHAVYPRARSSRVADCPFVSLQPPRPGGGHGPRQPSVSNTKPGIQGGWVGEGGHRDSRTPRDLSDLTPGRQASNSGSRGNMATLVSMPHPDAPDRIWTNPITPRKILEQTTMYSVYFA